jgi:hypothetical protein
MIVCGDILSKKNSIKSLKSLINSKINIIKMSHSKTPIFTFIKCKERIKCYICSILKTI